MKIISVYSGKGGVGKSTIAINLAGFYSIKHKQKVCVVDEDEQKSLLDIYGKSLLPFDVVAKMPRSGYDIVIKDHHPTHNSIKLGEIIICPIRASRLDFESYKRARAVIGRTPHILVVSQWSARIADDKDFIAKVGALCKNSDTPFATIKHRNIFKRMTDAGLTVYNAELKYGASDARRDISLLGGLINA